MPVKYLKASAGLIKWWLVQILASHCGKSLSHVKLELHVDDQGWICTHIFLRGESRFHVSIPARCLIPFCLAEASLSHLSDHHQNEDLLPLRSLQACVWLLLWAVPSVCHCQDQHYLNIIFLAIPEGALNHSWNLEKILFISFKCDIIDSCTHSDIR